MRPPRANFKEDILKLVADNEGMARKMLREVLACGEAQFKIMLDKMVADKEIHIFTKHNADYLYTFGYAKSNKIPGRAKRKTKAYGKELARLEGKAIVSGYDQSDIAARTRQRFVESCWLSPSRVSAT